LILMPKDNLDGTHRVTMEFILVMSPLFLCDKLAQIGYGNPKSGLRRPKINGSSQFRIRVYIYTPRVSRSVVPLTGFQPYPHDTPYSSKWRRSYLKRSLSARDESVSSTAVVNPHVTKWSHFRTLPQLSVVGARGFEPPTPCSQISSSLNAK
jgi:hypothetical protein